MEDATSFELHRAKLAASLAAMVDTMRNCADMADSFATFVKGSQYTVPEVASGKGKRKVVVDDENGKKRKRKLPKDPNAPKRPPSSYLMFQNEIRKELKDKNPDISNAELLSMVSDQWKHMSEAQKKVYDDLSKNAKALYSQSKLAYDNRTPEEVEAANAATAAAAIEKKELSKKARKAKAAEAAASKDAAAARAPPTPTADSTSGSGSEEDASDEEEEEVVQEKESDAEGSASSSEEEEEEPTPKRSRKVAVPVVAQPAKKSKKSSKA